MISSFQFSNLRSSHKNGASSDKDQLPTATAGMKPILYSSCSLLIQGAFRFQSALLLTISGVKIAVGVLRLISYMVAVTVALILINLLQHSTMPLPSTNAITIFPGSTFFLNRQEFQLAKKITTWLISGKAMYLGYLSHLSHKEGSNTWSSTFLP